MDAVRVKEELRLLRNHSTNNQKFCKNIFRVIIFSKDISLQVSKHLCPFAPVHRALRTAWHRGLKTKGLVTVGTVIMNLEENRFVHGYPHATI